MVVFPTKAKHEHERKYLMSPKYEQEKVCVFGFTKGPVNSPSHPDPRQCLEKVNVKYVIKRL
jgi:hypothetical protein